LFGEKGGEKGGEGVKLSCNQKGERQGKQYPKKSQRRQRPGEKKMKIN